MDPKQELLDLLRELLQLDHPELDFGIYRLVNPRRDELESFLSHEFLDGVSGELAGLEASSREQLQRELIELETQLTKLKVPFENSERWLQLKAEIASAIDIRGAEADVYSSLYRFFRRYYKAGDFIPLRRYKEGTYAIPYEGEEVTLYWANRDQYYVKSTERFRTFGYSTSSGKHIELRLASAEVDGDNKKSATATSRRFGLASPPVTEDGDRMVINLAFRSEASPPKQAEINKQLAAEIVEIGTSGWKSDLTEHAGNDDRTLLEEKLDDFTARNTFDYFVHKNLSKFLNRELDNFARTEVVDLSHVLDSKSGVSDATAAKARAFLAIGRRVIAFVSQVEDLQLRLFTKAKFVLEADYCLTIDRVPLKFHEQILSCSSQVEEWRTLFGLEVPSIEELRAHPFLVLDTRHFDREFKQKLRAACPDLDVDTNGLLIKGDNRQALRLLRSSCLGQVQTIYIDPPFNTEGDEFLYKDAYKTSSWLSMMHDRLSLARPLLSSDGTIHVHIDHNANFVLRALLDQVFGSDHFINEVIWRIGWVSGYKTAAPRYVRNHDTIYVYASGGAYKFNKSAAKIEYRNFSEDTIRGPLNDIRREWSVDPKEVRNTKVAITLKDGSVVRIGLSTKEGRYNVEDTWNSNEYEQLNSNKIKRNVAEYTPNGSDLTQKPEELLKRVVEVATDADDVVLDFFAGSGTTPATALKLGRRFIAVEMGDYFDTDLLWRMKQVLFGREVGISSQVPYAGGGSFKHIRLESYDDTLENTRFRRTVEQETLLSEGEATSSMYLLHYMVAREAVTSPFEDDQLFERPFDVSIVMTDDSGRRVSPIDMVETFNFLTGLRVAKFHDGGSLLCAQEGFMGSDQVLVIWRDQSALDETSFMESLTHLGLTDRLAEFARVYVNGDTSLARLRGETDQWELMLTDDEFVRLMFEDA